MLIHARTRSMLFLGCPGNPGWVPREPRVGLHGPMGPYGPMGPLDPGAQGTQGGPWVWLGLAWHDQVWSVWGQHVNMIVEV